MKKLNPIYIINCAELTQANWNFLEDQIKELEVEWTFFTCLPQNSLEKLIRKPDLGRYRACLQTVLKAKLAKADYIITHMPRAACWVAIFAKAFRVNVQHLAFSFNFTNLPTGLSCKIMRRAFQNVDRFVVYSQAEKSLYAEYFGIPLERIDVLPWCMKVPLSAPNEPLVKGEYICAVGGEGRDYISLIEAVRHLPDIPLVIVARPHNLKGAILPPNVQLLTNLSNPQFWNIVKFSKLSVIPLRDAQTNCGHISIVGSMMLGKPIVTTTSQGTRDYIEQNQTALISPPKDIEALAENIKKLWSDSNLCAKLGEACQTVSNHKFNLVNWTDYLENYLRNNYLRKDK